MCVLSPVTINPAFLCGYVGGIAAPTAVVAIFG